MIKKLILRIISYIAILYLIDSFIFGFEFGNSTALIAFAILLAITHIAINPLVKFFTLPINLMTFGVFNFLISCLYIYFFNLIIPGFQIVDGYIGPYVTDIIQIPQIKVAKLGIVVIAAIIIAIMNSVVSWSSEK